LAFPEVLDGEFRRRLLDAGASPDRWIVCFHARQDDYEFRKFREPDRSVDPHSYFRLADYVIDELGGQVVRLGDPSMTPAPARPHLIDLSTGSDFLLQAYAVSRCRFAITTDSGMQHVANGLGVPFATTNATALDIVLDGCGFPPWHDQHFVLTKEVFAKDAIPDDLSEFGRRTDFNECVMFDNGSRELRAVTDRMMAKTSDCQGWRDSYIEGNVEAADTISFPFPSVPTRPNWFKKPWWEVSPELASTLVELRKQAKRDGLIP
jgi:putative glycosyltransferase (TIGR04372 family)